MEDGVGAPEYRKGIFKECSFRFICGIRKESPYVPEICGDHYWECPEFDLLLTVKQYHDRAMGRIG